MQNHSALNGEGPKTNNPDGMQESYPTLTAGHALHLKACEQQQQTERLAGWGARAEEGGLLSEECMLTSSAAVMGSGFPACWCWGGPICFLLPRVIWVGGWVYSRYDHKMLSYFLKKHIIIIIIQDNIPFLPFFLLLATTNGMEFCSHFVSGNCLLVLGRWDQFPAPEDFWFDLHLWKGHTEPLWEYWWLLCSLHHPLFLLSIFSTVHKGNTVYQPLVLTVLFPLDDLHMCSWKIILKTKGGGEGKEKNIPWVFGKIAWNLLWHLIVFSLSSPYTNQPEAMTSAMGSASLLLPGAEEHWKTWGRSGEREGITVCPSREQAARWWAASPIPQPALDRL